MLAPRTAASFPYHPFVHGQAISEPNSKDIITPTVRRRNWRGALGLRPRIIASIAGLAAGFWKHIFDTSAKSRDSLHLIDTIVKAHRAASGEKAQSSQAIGISRGGRSTTIHAVVDGKGRSLNLSVTGGEVHDGQAVGELLDTPRPPLAVETDKASAAPMYAADQARRHSGGIQEGLPSQALLSSPAQDRELLLPDQGLATHCHPLISRRWQRRKRFVPEPCCMPDARDQPRLHEQSSIRRTRSWPASGSALARCCRMSQDRNLPHYKILEHRQPYGYVYVGEEKETLVAHPLASLMNDACPNVSLCTPITPSLI